MPTPTNTFIQQEIEAMSSIQDLEELIKHVTRVETLIRHRGLVEPHERSKRTMNKLKHAFITARSRITMRENMRASAERSRAHNERLDRLETTPHKGDPERDNVHTPRVGRRHYSSRKRL